MIWVAVGLWVVSTSAIGWVLYKIGYSHGWVDRDVDMRLTPGQAEQRALKNERMRHTGIWNA